MAKRGCVVYQMMAVLVALYGVMSACICTDHVASQVAMPACHHCGPSQDDAAGAQLASHHQCCGMERAPIAIEKVSSPIPIQSGMVVLLSSAVLFSDANFRTAALPSLSHAPPHELPIYFTTQRFVI